MRKKTVWVAQTAILLALLILLQGLTAGLGQIVTGCCVNAVLAIAALTAGAASGLTVALVSPALAFLLGVGPQLLPLVPAIAAGNAVFVSILRAAAGGPRAGAARSLLGWMGAAVCKFLTLYLIVVRLLCPLLPLSQTQTAVLTAMFSWPQLLTALTGGAAALLAAPLIRKAAGGSGETAG